MEVIFLLGQAENVDAVRAIVGRYSSPEQVEESHWPRRANGGMPGWACCRCARRCCPRICCSIAGSFIKR